MILEHLCESKPAIYETNSDAELSICQSAKTPRASNRNQAISSLQEIYPIQPALFLLQYFRRNLFGAVCHHQYAPMLINIAYRFLQRFRAYVWLLSHSRNEKNISTDPTSQCTPSPRH